MGLNPSEAPWMSTVRPSAFRDVRVFAQQYPPRHRHLVDDAGALGALTYRFRSSACGCNDARALGALAQPPLD